jgi:hypothetical protein
MRLKTTCVMILVPSARIPRVNSILVRLHAVAQTENGNPHLAH